MRFRGREWIATPSVLPLEGYGIVDDTLSSTRVAVKMGKHDSGFWIRSSQRFSDRRSEDLALFRTPRHAGKVPGPQFWGMLVVGT